ncbi:LuxR family transcriptional regulator [Rhizocola hellebori]|uniref:LuxR family transcriptional regulator n=2 Tax=Rhizocola hellebori TaxID=1392758 RepID=A0A8J3QGY5_9ACTN|nr:LuxR family transcriptional regulator [Rhizocola hellebori]
MRLIAAKLEPPRTPTKFVARDRLHTKLDKGAGRQLTLVVGPAGSGKSALLASWLNRRAILGAGAWLSLDEFDNEPVRLWSYLLAALRRCAVGDQLRGLTDQSLARGVDADLISEVAAALGGLSTPLVLVLDNVDRLRDGPAASSIASLLRHSIPQLHLVLSSRSEPPLPLGRLHVAGELARVGPDDLAFSTSEAGQLWAMRSLPIRDDEARALVTQTEGWAAALCLKAQDDDQPDAFAEFLRCEVMSGMTAQTRGFLLRTSVAGTLTAELADAITGRRQGAAMLERLRRQSLVVRDAHASPGWVRYRQPFLGFLRQEARLELTDELAELHLRAARWYAAQDDPVHAVEHAIAAADWRYAASIVVRHAPAQLFGPHRQALLALIDRLPVPGAAQQPEIAAALALAAADRGQSHDAEGFLVLARHSGARLPADRQPAWRAALRLAELMLARHRQDWPGVHAAAGELSAVLDGAMPGSIPAAAHLHAVISENVGQAWLWEARFERAGDNLQAALAKAREHRLDLVEVSALGTLALREAIGGHLHEAARLANAAVRLLEPAGRLRSKHATLSLLALALIQWLRGHPLKAGQRLAAAHAADRHEPSLTGSAAHAAIRAMLLLSQREVAAARQLLAESKVESGHHPLPALVRDWLAIMEAEIQLQQGHAAGALAALSAAPPPAHPLAARAAIVAARAHLADGAPAHAISLLSRLHSAPAMVGPWARADAWLVHALAAERLGHDGAVTIALNEALSAAAAEDLFEPFLSAGIPVATLLSGHRDLLAGHGSFGQRLRELLPAPAAEAHPDPPVLEPITEREAVVLRYLPTLLTMKDIAGELSVSPNTVKSHLRSLYRKLAVGNRREAVRHARKLGLLRSDPAGTPGPKVSIPGRPGGQDYEDDPGVSPRRPRGGTPRPA